MTGELVLGTRGSRLALEQANRCAGRLRRAGLAVRVQTIKTTSEHLPETPLSVIDRRDVFTRQLDEALLAGGIDLAVHSAKDVPTEIPDGIVVAAMSDRHHPGDDLVSDRGYGLLGEGDVPLPEGAVVATSSVRRKALLLHLRPDVRVVEIRGNVDTRIRKMREGAADALLLASAGIERLGIERLGLDVRRTPVTAPIFLPAVGQGALAVTTLGDHALASEIREALNDPAHEKTVLAERAVLAALEGGCRTPVGAHARVEPGGEIHLRAVIASPDGALVYKAESAGTDPERVGVHAARELMRQGAVEILDEIQKVRR